MFQKWQPKQFHIILRRKRWYFEWNTDAPSKNTHFYNVCGTKMPEAQPRDRPVPLTAHTKLHR